MMWFVYKLLLVASVIEWGWIVMGKENWIFKNFIYEFVARI